MDYRLEHMFLSRSKKRGSGVRREGAGQGKAELKGGLEVGVAGRHQVGTIVAGGYAASPDSG